jgi:hypothetical protein
VAVKSIVQVLEWKRCISHSQYYLSQEHVGLHVAKITFNMKYMHEGAGTRIQFCFQSEQPARNVISYSDFV